MIDGSADTLQTLSRRLWSKCMLHKNYTWSLDISKNYQVVTGLATSVQPSAACTEHQRLSSSSCTLTCWLRSGSSCTLTDVSAGVWVHPCAAHRSYCVGEKELPSSTRGEQGAYTPSLAFLRDFREGRIHGSSQSPYPMVLLDLEYPQRFILPFLYSIKNKPCSLSVVAHRDLPSILEG